MTPFPGLKGYKLWAKKPEKFYPKGGRLSLFSSSKDQKYFIS